MNLERVTMKQRTLKRNPAYLMFTVSLAVATAFALLLFSDCWEEYATARYWRRIADRHAQAESSSWNGQTILPSLRSLYAENPDIVGWIRIEDTAINYPVMQTKDDPEYYLLRNFERNFSNLGTPFADYRCQVTPVQGFNTVLYLHDGLMLQLNQYFYLRDYYETHHQIHFDTLTEEGVYEVIAAFYADAEGTRLLNPWNPDHEQAYEFYNYLETDSPEGFQKYLDGIQARQALPVTVDLSPRSHILTLICCAQYPFSGIEETGRLVVIAKRVEP